MRKIAARDARNGFGRLLDEAERSPVRVTRAGRPDSVVMSADRYERLRGEAWDRLAETMDAMSRQAAANGLTESKLEEMLAGGER